MSLADIPPHKLIPTGNGGHLLIDGFNYAHRAACSGHGHVEYLLSHGHSDHYTGIRSDWSLGPIYCSDITAKLIAHLVGVDASFLHPLPLNRATTLPSGCQVTLIDANHCPGAVIFLIKLPDGRKVIHTGDFRLSEAMLTCPLLRNFRGAEALYLDTTYCSPKYAFPPQDVAVEYTASTIHRLLQEDVPYRRLFLISTYVIGKERIFQEVAKRCGVKIYASDRKAAVMACLEDVLPQELFTDDPAATPVHLVPWNGFLGETWPYFRPNWKAPREYAAAHGADTTIGFVPTGWVHAMSKTPFPIYKESEARAQGVPLTVHLVPYSEHCSYEELKTFVGHIRPIKVIPTVGAGDDKAHAKVLKHFTSLTDASTSKARFIRRLGGGTRKALGGDVNAPEEETSLIAHVSRGPAPAALPQLDGTSHVDVDEDEDEDAEIVGGNVECGVAIGIGNSAYGDDDGVIQRCQQDRDVNEGSLAETAGRKTRELDEAQNLDEAAEAYAAAHAGTQVVHLDEQHSPRIGEGKKVDTDVTKPNQNSNLTFIRRPGKEPALPGTGVLSADVDRRDEVVFPRTDRGTGGSSADGGFDNSRQEGGINIPPPANDPTSGKMMLIDLSNGLLSDDDVAQLLKAAQGDVSVAANMFFENRWRPGNQERRGETTVGVGLQEQRPRQGEQQHVAIAGSGANKRKPPSTGEPPEQRGSVKSVQSKAAPTTPLKRRKRTSGAGNGERGGDGQRSILSFFGNGAQHRRNTACKDPAAGAISDLPPPLEQDIDHPAAVQTQPSPVIDLTKTDKERNTASLAPALPIPLAVAPLTTASTPKSSIPRDAVTLPLRQYHPIRHACWTEKTPTPYLHLARAFEAMESTTKRLRISDVLVNAFRSVLALNSRDLVAIAYLSVGKLAPDYEGVELNVGGATVAAAITEATGVNRAKLRDMYNEMGDMGDVAAACKRTQSTLAPPAPLTIAGVLATLRAMAAEKGQGSSQRRQRAALRMLRSCREAETKYLVRTLVQNLRVGANWRSVVPALARAVVIHQTQAEALTQYLSVPEGTEPRTQRGLPPPPSKTDLDAAAAAAVAAFHVCPNLDMLVSALLDGEPVQEVYRRCKLTPGIPLKPMLGKITTGIADAVSQLGGARFLAEFKYDGVRSQIHVLSDGQIKVFSRNCEDRTSSFPDVAAQIRDAMRGGEASKCVFDAEVVAVDRNGVDTMGSGGAGAGVEAMQEEETAMLAATVNAANEHRAAPAPAAEIDSVRLRPFQELAARPRGAVDIESLKVDVCVFVFDLLELNGESMLTKPLRHRRESLQRALPGLRAGYVQLAQGYEFDVELAMHKAAAHAQGGGAIAADKLPTDAGSNKGGHTSPATDANAQNETEPGITSVVDRVQSTLLEALAAGAEGLMLKDLNATYEPSKRSSHWLKLKKDYCDGMVDTLDLVVIGAFYGNGRKTGWYSPFLLAAWDPETETYQSVCRCLSGFTDEFYKAATARLSATIVPKKPYIVDTLESPDVWFEPREVWEIRGADLTLSPVHRAAAGMVHPERGVGLRFPRFLGIRDDKTPEDATTSVTIAGMFEAQRRGAAAATAGKEREEREDDDVADVETVDDDFDAGGVGGGLKVA